MSWAPFSTGGTDPALLLALAQAGFAAGGKPKAMEFLGLHLEDADGAIPIGEELAGSEPCVIVGWTLEAGGASYAHAGNTGAPFTPHDVPLSPSPIPPALVPPGAKLVIWTLC